MAECGVVLSASNGAVRTLDEPSAERAALEAHADQLCDTAEALARVFRAGGRLLTQSGARFAHDAAHVTVEFLHPVITGARALPALRLDATDEVSAVDRLRTMAHQGDAWLGIGAFEDDPALVAGASEAGRLGLLTIAIVDGESTGADADHVIRLTSDDGLTLREQLVTSYHILWELVHIVLAHDGTAP